MSNHERLTFAEEIKRRAFDHPITAVFIVVAATIIGFGKLTEALNSIGVMIGLKPDALALANEDAKGEFSRHLTEMAWRRLFWINNYTARKRRNAETSDIEIAWNKYISAVEDWSVNLVNNEQLLKRYYDNKKESYFHNTIHPAFQSLHEKMNDLRYKKMSPESSLVLIGTIQKNVDKLNSNLQVFVTGLSVKPSQNQ